MSRSKPNRSQIRRAVADARSFVAANARKDDFAGGLADDILAPLLWERDYRTALLREVLDAMAECSAGDTPLMRLIRQALEADTTPEPTPR